jgi:hypothetical protein
VNGAHHSNCASGKGICAGKPKGTPGGNSSLASKVSRHESHKTVPSTAQPAHEAGSARSSNVVAAA